MANGLGGALVGLLGIAIAADIAGKVITKSSKNIGMRPMKPVKMKKVKMTGFGYSKKKDSLFI